MSKIESSAPKTDKETTSRIKDFWTRNINAERIMGKDVTVHQRGDDNYFKDIEAQRYRSHRHLMPWISSMQPGKTVLEIGCGIGLDSFTMAKHGLRLTGIDLTEVGIKTVQKRFSDNQLVGEFSVGDACNLPFLDDSFDYVYSFGVLHHTADTEKSIAEAYRVLKPGGEALIMLYHRHSLNELVHRIAQIPFEDKDELCPIVRRFTRSEVKEIFKDFARINIHLDFVYGEGYGKVFKLTPTWLYKLMSRHLGWHMMIRATK